MRAPAASRPYMPGDGIQGPSEGAGLLSWSWATERFAASHDYWVATVSAGGSPHVMPVWGLWFGETIWFSSSRESRKSNLRREPQCTMTTDDPFEPVIVEGVAELVSDEAQLAAVLDAENRKYDTDYGIEMLDPAVNCCFRVWPRQAFGLLERDFTGPPTRWTFDTPADPE
jgi:Pyridoxamine 5'-phosphate oxidase